MHGLKVAMAWLCAPCWKGRRVPSDSLPLTSYHPSPPQSSGVNSRPPVPVGGVELGGRAIQNPILQARLEPVQAPPKRRPPPAASGKVPMGQPVPIGGGKPWGDLGCTSSEGISGVKLGGVSGYEGGWGATAPPLHSTSSNVSATAAPPKQPQTYPRPPKTRSAMGVLMDKSHGGCTTSNRGRGGGGGRASVAHEAHEGETPMGQPVASVPQPSNARTNRHSSMKTDCVVCMDAAATHALVPCGHKCVCETCAEKLDICPKCRGTIQARVRIFN